MAPFRALTPLVLACSLAAGPLAGQAIPPGKSRVRSTRSNLFTGLPSSGYARANRVGCVLVTSGGVCSNQETEDGNWPVGTVDTYLFQSGIQVAGIVSPSAGVWPGDTVGAFFIDFRGDQVNTAPLTPLFDSRDTSAIRQWPAAALISDTAIFAPNLLGRSNASDQDLWTRYWDGDPSRDGGRKHPMGVVVDQRAMEFNGPGFDADILYLVYTITNVTASDPAAYSGIDPATRGDYIALGAKFKQVNDSAFGVNIPTGGYRIDSVFVNEAMDPDVGDNAGDNYSTVSLPFGAAFAYQGNFSSPSWSFPADVFGGRGLAAAPGLVGVKFLRYPVDSAGKQVGIRIFTNTVSGGTVYPDPVGIDQLYRYLSGTSSPASGDNPCTDQTNHLLLEYCVAWQTSMDTRFNLSTGPFVLAPGQQQTVVLAYLFAAPRDTVLPYVNGDLKPGFPALGDSIAADTTRVRLIERIAGWVTQADANADGAIEENEVTTWPGSFLNKARLAQAYADAKFEIPQAPAAPGFYLIPSDKQVTVVWQKSRSEMAGDPYFAIASDPTNALYDPNFRKFDVEGYRIYRGLNPNALQLVAQLDYSGTVMTDYTGAFDYGTQCAPELGIETACPVAFPSTPNPAIHADHPLAGPIVQIPVGGRLLTTNGAVAVVHADTAVTGGNSAFPPLEDTGITFSYTDVGVLNSFTYYYSVTAFDVNSLRSGPSSLESPRLVKAATPRTDGSITNALIVDGLFGDDSVLLVSNSPYPSIDPATGAFSGPIPPSSSWSFDVVTSATQLLPRGRVVAHIDSVSAGFAGVQGQEPTVYATLSAGGDSLRQAIPLSASFLASAGFSQTLPLIIPDSTAAGRYGGAADSGTRVPVSFVARTGPIGYSSPGVSVLAGRYSGASATARYLAHSRWFDEGGSEPADPTIDGDPSPSHNSGALTGVSLIWAPQAYRSDSAAPVGLQFHDYAYTATSWYPADFTVTWNADSSVTLRDQTHHVTLPVAVNGGAGYGFLNVRAFAGPGVTAANLADGTGTTNVPIVSYHHLYATQPLCTGSVALSLTAIPCVSLERTAQYEPLDFNSDGVADANGIVLLVNGEPFFMAMGQIPAAGTKWHLRAVSGEMSATCTPAVGAVMADCSSYAFTPPSPSPGVVPGLNFVIDIQRPFSVDTLGGDLSRVHTVPDPFYVTNALAVSPDTQHLEFVHLPARAIIRIYSVSGRLVAHLTHNDPTGGGQEDWNVRSRDGKIVASGVYFYVIEAPDHRLKTGRFTVVSFRP